MMLLALAMAQAAPSTPPALGEIGRQSLPASGCAAYLWRAEANPVLVAMVAATPGSLRINADGVSVLLPRTAARGDTQLGLPASSDYAGSGFTATLDLTVTPQPGLADGARVPAGTLQVARTGGDAVVMPVAGLVGCGKVRS